MMHVIRKFGEKEKFRGERCHVKSVSSESITENCSYLLVQLTGLQCNTHAFQMIEMNFYILLREQGLVYAWRPTSSVEEGCQCLCVRVCLRLCVISFFPVFYSRFFLFLHLYRRVYFGGVPCLFGTCALIYRSLVYPYKM